MAVSTILGRQTVLAAGLSINGDAAAIRSHSSVEAVGHPGLRISGRSSRLKESSTFQLRSEFLSSFTASIPLRQRRSNRASARRGGALTTTSSTSTAVDLKQARDEIKTVLAEKKCHPILIRLGWHDSGTFDKNISDWPKRGGANGSLRFSLELGHAANSGLSNALLLLQKIKDKFPSITYADLFQLASATAIEDAGGPKVPMRYGRVDTASEAECAIEGNLPDGAPPDPADHLRKVFYRMGLNDKEIVALSGAHTVGRSRADRSGFGKPETKYTSPKDKSMGEPGGQSWTVEWLTFDNAYFKDIIAQSDEDLLVLPTDKILTEDPDFKVYTEKYAKDQDAFFKDYAEAHAKLSELGSKFDPPEGYTIDGVESATDAVKESAAGAVKEVAAPVAEKFVASKYSSTAEGSTQTPLSENMKKKIRAEYLAVGGSPDKPLTSNYFLNIIIVIAVLAVLSSFVTQNQGAGF